jgi:hypothetical protein
VRCERFGDPRLYRDAWLENLASMAEATMNDFWVSGDDEENLEQ